MRGMNEAIPLNRADSESWFPTLAPERRRKDGARSILGRLSVHFRRKSSARGKLL